MSQLHKRFTSEQVKELLERYLRNEIKRKHLQEILGIKERRFFALVRQKKQMRDVGENATLRKNAFVGMVRSEPYYQSKSSPNSCQKKPAV